MQQWVEPIVGVTDPLSSPPSLGGVLYIQNYLQQLAPASYGIQNWSFNGASFAAKNHAQTAFVDMLHLDINDRTVVGAGSTRTIIGSGALAFTTLPTNAANDAAAASAGVAVGGVYRNASALMVRVA
jgi:hypothetical protein